MSEPNYDLQMPQGQPKQKPVNKVAQAFKIGVPVILIAGFLWTCSSCFSPAANTGSKTASTTAHETTPPTQSETSKQINALVESQMYIKPLLKSPATAKFPLITADDIAVKKTNDNTYLVAAYVDSENSFGALMRTYYICNVVFLDNNTYQIKDFEIIEN